MRIGISACLLGDKVRYDQTDKRNEDIINLLKGHEIIRICPEMSAGFPLPHEPLEIRGNSVFSKSGEDVSSKLLEGSRSCFKMIKDCDLVILKSKSPSCGYKKIYDGSFSGRLIDGNGIFTSLCIGNGITVFNELQLEEIKEYLNPADSAQ